MVTITQKKGCYQSISLYILLVVSLQHKYFLYSITEYLAKCEGSRLQEDWLSLLADG